MSNAGTSGKSCVYTFIVPNHNVGTVNTCANERETNEQDVQLLERLQQDGEEG